MAGISLL